jgi:hypothetical protein
MTGKNIACVQMFADKEAGDIYSAVIAKLQSRIGQQLALEDAKQTCVHIVAGKGGTAYAGLHPRKGGVLLNIRLQAPLKSKRFRKVEQVSKNRCHCEVLLSSVTDVDDEILGWLECAARME